MHHWCFCTLPLMLEEELHGGELSDENGFVMVAWNAGGRPRD